MKIWMSEITGQSDNKYAVRMVLGILGCIILAMFTAAIGAVVSIKLEEHKEVISLLSLLFGTLLVVWCAVRLGKMSVRDTLIFCKDENDNLFVLNLRDKVRHRKGIIGYTAMAAETERLQTQLKNDGILEEKMKDGTIGRMACEILSVRNIKPQKDGHSLVCDVRFPSGRTGKATYLLYHGYDQEDELLYHLERRLHKVITGEVEKNPYPVRIAVSALALAGVIVLCVLSHPAVAILPEAIYFPCFGLAYVPLCVMLYYIIKMRRGE